MTPALSRDELILMFCRLPLGEPHILTRREEGERDGFLGRPPCSTGAAYDAGYAEYAEYQRLRVEVLREKLRAPEGEARYDIRDVRRGRVLTK